MKLVTSYFANIKNIPDDYELISICGKAPDWYTGLQYKKLAPKLAFFLEWKQNKDNDFYIRHFNDEVLSKLNAIEIYNTLFSKTNKDKICLLCYEQPGDFCHRHLVADWFNSHGIKCEELNLHQNNRLF